MQIRRGAVSKARALCPADLIIVVALCVSSLGMTSVQALDVKPVESFDITKYLGTWHEIASIPQFFQRKCVRDTKATYSAAGDSLIRVDNVCTRDDGTRERVSGRAREGDPSRRYGWILSREPLLPTAAVAEIIGRLKSQGYDACEFIVTPQTGGLSLRRPLCNTLP